MSSRKFVPSISFTILVLMMYGLAGCMAQEPAATTVSATTPPQPTQTTAPTLVPTPQATPSITLSESGNQALTLVWQSEFTPEAAVGAGVDLAVDPQGNIFITTANVKKYDSQGKYITQWGKLGKGEGEFSLPTGIAVDAHGHVYVNDFRNKRIQKFDSNGKFLFQWGTNPAGSPGSIAINGEGQVYVSLFETADHNIQKFDDFGNLLASWGGTGAGPGQFATRIEDITLDKDGNLYVTDSFNHRIQKFDANGNFLAAFGGEPSRNGNGQFFDPEGLAVDTQGNIYVVDNYFLQKLDANGNFIAQWSKTEGGELDRAGFVAVDDQGDLYILARTDVTTATGEVFNVLFIKKFKQS